MKNKGGRPKKQIDKDSFEKLCGLQCTKAEIQAWFDVSDKTLDRWVKETYGNESSFSEVFGQKRGLGKISLRRKQYETALSGNPTLLIWLGKQYLGQSDKQALDHSGTDTFKLNYDPSDND